MSESVRSDSQQLAQFGYKQELHRTLGGFSSFAPVCVVALPALPALALSAHRH